MKLLNNYLSKALLALTMLFISVQTYAQYNEITDGTEYWLGIPNCRKSPEEAIRFGEYPIMLWLSSKVNTKATVTIKALDFVKNVNITKNKTTVVELSDIIMNRESEVIQNWGIHVQGEDPITVAVYMAYEWSGETFRCIPIEWLGQRYVTTNLYLDRTDVFKPPQILIIATEDKTTVSYTPTANTVKVKKGQTKTVTLNKGDTYLIEGAIEGYEYLVQTSVTDLTGTYIVASKPIAVISGHTKGAFPRYYMGTRGGWTHPTAHFARNMLIEMLWPVELLGKEYVSAPFKYRARVRGKSGVQDDFGDLIRFIAVDNGTKIYRMRKDGTSFMKIGVDINRGEYVELTNEEEPGYFMSNKPVLMSQMGKTWWNEPGMMGPITEKKDNKDQIQNPHQSGVGMLIVIAPIDHWCSYAQWRSPEGLDNFIYITFEMKHLKHIKYDGKPLTSTFGTSVVPIKGTPYAYVTEQISAGDHWLEADSGAKYAAYAYGNWDYEKDGFAFGYPIGVNYASPCEDTMWVEDAMDCGDVTGTCKVAPPDSSCAAIFNIWLDKAQSINYLLEVDPFERGSAKEVKFKLTVVDKKAYAKAVVNFMSRSGRTIQKVYEYEPEQVEANPKDLDFGLLEIGIEKCLNFDLINKGKLPVTVTELRLKAGKPEYKIDVTGLPVTIPAGESKPIKVCATALQAYKEPLRDTIIAKLKCFEQVVVALELLAGTPVVWIDDAEWKDIPINREVPRDVVIVNKGSVTVELKSVDWADKKHFTRTDLTFPVIIEPEGKKYFKVWYRPDVAGVRDSTRALFVGNTTVEKLWSDWVGNGISAGPAIVGYDWQYRRVIDNYSKNVLGISEYAGTVVIENTSTTGAVLDVKDVYIENDFGGVFKIVDKNSIPKQLNAGEKKDIPVTFAPKTDAEDNIEEYSTNIIFKAEYDGNLSVVQDILHGIETQPHINVEGEDFRPAIVIGQSKNGNGAVISFKKSELTKMPLKVTKLWIDGPDKNNFVIDPNFFITNPLPFNMPAEGKINIPIRFTATKGGVHTARIYAEGDAPETPSDELIGEGYLEGLKTTDHDFGKHWKTLTAPAGVVTLENNGTGDLEIKTQPQLSGADKDFFTIVKYSSEISGQEITQFPYQLSPNDKLLVEVTFTPMDKRPYSANVDYITGIGNAASNVKGEGNEIRSRTMIPVYTSDPNYKGIIPGREQLIDVIMVKHPDEIQLLETADIYEFEVSVDFNSNNDKYTYDIYPMVTDKDKIFTNNTLTQGWNVESVVFKETDFPTYKTTTMTVRFRSTNKPLKGEGVLFQFKIRAFLGDATVVSLPGDFKPINTPWVIPDFLDGEVKIVPICVNSFRIVQLLQPTALYQSVPNPTTGSVKISYAVGEDSYVNITLYNNFGQKIITLLDQKLGKGVYDLTFDVNQLGLTSGLYEYRMISGSYSDSKQMIITK